MHPLSCIPRKFPNLHDPEVKTLAVDFHVYFKIKMSLLTQKLSANVVIFKM